MPRPPAPIDEHRHEEPAEGSRETVQHELRRTAKKRDKASHESREEKLDDAVEMTFPASDPPLAGRPTGTERAGQPLSRQAPLISTEEVDRASRGLGDRSTAQSEQPPMVPGDDAPPGTIGTGEDICPVCRGHGRLGGATCKNCEGRGKVNKGIGGA